jgi:hypothetical protein
VTPELAALYCAAKRIDEYGPSARKIELLCRALAEFETRNPETDDTWSAYCKRERLSGTGHRRLT